MPGPRNQKKKKKLLAKPPLKTDSPRQSLSSLDNVHTTELSDRSSPAPYTLRPPTNDLTPPVQEVYIPARDDEEHEGLIPQTPYIHDPGNGPRVRDTRAFLNSYFAQPPALNDPLCAEFAQEEVSEMLCSVLPMETALVCDILALLLHDSLVWLYRFCGITKAVRLGEYVRLANDCTV